MALVHIVLFAALLAIGAADLAQFTSCDESNNDVCKVSEVRINPCPKGKVCVFKRKTNASIAFDFTPNFSGSNLKTMVWWTTPTGNLEFPNFGSSNACDYTSCPVVAGQAQTLNYNLHVAREYPPSKYDLKWKLWNPDNTSEMCCFKIKIEISRTINKH